MNIKIRYYIISLLNMIIPKTSRKIFFFDRGMISFNEIEMIKWAITSNYHDRYRIVLYTNCEDIAKKMFPKGVTIISSNWGLFHQLTSKYIFVEQNGHKWLGINLDGKKDMLGMWIGENGSAKFWATVLNGLKNRGVEDIFIACTDNLTGFSAAIEAVFPKNEIQNCIIHQLRNSGKYVSYKDIKALMADLKAVYTAVDEAAALDALDVFSDCWDKKYPKIPQSWRDNWANLSTYFKFPQEVRRLIYTTNTIEGFNRQLRKVTKSKSVFPTDDSLLKMLYLAMMDITKKWTGRRQEWSVIYAQMAIFFGDRIPE